MLFTLETIGLCLLFYWICWSSTGTDEKNIKSFRSYPDEVQKMLREDPVLRDKIKEPSLGAVFLSNVVLFSVILLPFGISVSKDGFILNFLNMLIMGQCINAFDLIMDLIWFRHSKRTRFEGTKDQDALYQDPKNHIKAFLRGILAFIVVAIVDGFVLSLF